VADYVFQPFIVNAGLLDEEIRATASFAAVYEGLAASGDVVKVHTSTDLSTAELSELEAIIAAHNPSVVGAASRLAKNQEFARALIDKWLGGMSEKDLLGSEFEYGVARSIEAPLSFGLLGLVYAMEQELANVIPVGPYLSAAEVTEIRNEIRAYLGMLPV